jgi:hypothetical protein
VPKSSREGELRSRPPAHRPGPDGPWPFWGSGPSASARSHRAGFGALGPGSASARRLGAGRAPARPVQPKGADVKVDLVTDPGLKPVKPGQKPASPLPHGSWSVRWTGQRHLLILDGQRTAIHDHQGAIFIGRSTVAASARGWCRRGQLGKPEAETDAWPIEEWCRLQVAIVIWPARRSVRPPGLLEMTREHTLPA